MPSPFPGMDPYLEAHWRDVHSSLIIYARDGLQPQLPSDLRARVEERVLVDASYDLPRAVYPDVRVVETSRAARSPGGAVSRVASEPILIDLGHEPMIETFLEITEVGSGRRLITTIEVLSLANKAPGEGQEKYLKKQEQMRQGGVNLVEIDLLRAGERRLVLALQRIRPEYRMPYMICVWRASRPTQAELYPVPLREELPVIRIPLRPADEDVKLDLQALVNECWEKGGYDDLDYTVEPDPPLEREDRAWASDRVRQWPSP